jgi:hypothetical protein
MKLMLVVAMVTGFASVGHAATKTAAMSVGATVVGPACAATSDVAHATTNACKGYYAPTTKVEQGGVATSGVASTAGQRVTVTY